MKKIIAVILTVSFLAVTPAQAAGPDRPDRKDVTTPSIGGGIVMTTQSIGGGIWCCTA